MILHILFVAGHFPHCREKYPRVKIIQHSNNLGFGEGYNRAINKVETGYVVLLNNDTEVLNPRKRELVRL